MSRFAPFLAGFAAAAGLFAAAWFLRVAPEREQERELSRDAVATAQNEVLKARRNAADRDLEARAERVRADELKQQLSELQKPTTLAPAPQPGTDHAPMPAQPVRDVEPEKWDRSRLNQEVENLTKVPAKALFRHPRLPLVVRGMHAHGDEGIDLLQQIVNSKGLKTEYVIAAAVIGGDLGDARLVPSYFARWKQEPAGDTRFALLRALSKLPGDEIVPGLVQAWTDETTEMHARGVAIEGLGRRGVDLAKDAALGTSKFPSGAALRFRALMGLRDRAEAGGWKDAELIALFGRSLSTSDGERQRRIAMMALEGFWNEAAAKQLVAFAEQDNVSPPEAARARKSADAILAGAPRPENAGVPERGQRDDD